MTARPFEKHAGMLGRHSSFEKIEYGSTAEKPDHKESGPCRYLYVLLNYTALHTS
jgi:hypothetical protein